MSYEVRTQNGRVLSALSGLMAEQDAAGVTLVDADYRKTRIPRTDIAKIEESEVSIYAGRAAGKADAAAGRS